ncbi:Zinc finger MYM-type protein 1 [Glycine soja]
MNLKKQKVEKLIESQRGARDKFAIIHKNDAEASSIDHTDNEENVIEQSPIDNTDNSVEQPPRDDTDNGLWKNIDGKLMIEKDPIRHDNFQYPKDENNRYFYSSCYQRTLSNGEKHDRRWLVYSKDLDKVYCFCCKLFGSTNVSQLANEGTKDWKNLGSKLKSHETNRGHIINMTKWIELEKRLTTKQTIDKHIQEQINKEKEHWEKFILRIIAIVKYLSKNNLSFRGTNEKIYEKGNGNFLSLIEMLAEFDPIMQEHVRRIKSNETCNHFLSNTKQNELIEMIAFQVKKSIIEKVNDAKYFSVILDCTPDVSHQEQMNLILRCVDTSKSPIKIEEYFLEFLKVDDTSGKCLFNELVNVLNKYGLNIDDIRGQGYDNGSNMKGKNQGVQRRLLDINLRAFYTSCGCHNLNLVLCDMASSSPRAISFVRVLQRIYSLFASSTKLWKILQDNASKFSVKSLSQTRWESRIENVKAIKFQAPKVRNALSELSKNCEDPKLKSEAMSLATHELEDFEFLLGMNIWYDILFVVNSVSKILQSKYMHIDVAIDHLKGLITYLKHYRENRFALTLESIEKMAIEMDIEPKFREKRKIHRKPHFDENISNEITHSLEESFRIEYFLYILDQSINSIETRFEQFLQYETIFGFLFDSKKIKALDEDELKKYCINLEKLLRFNEYSDIDGLDLFSELKVLREVLREKISTPIEVLSYIKTLDSFPNVYIAYRILLIIPVTVATAKRSFSKLKLLKSYLEPTMLQYRLNGLAILSIESEVLKLLDYKTLINDFAAKKARRLI